MKSVSAIIPGGRNQEPADKGLSFHMGLCYGDNVKGHHLDLIVSKEAVGPLPVIIYFHYGTMSRSGRSAATGMCRNLAKRGYAVINADIRPLSVTGGLKEALSDLDRLLRWLPSAADEYGLDLKRIYAAGTYRGAAPAVWSAMLCNGNRIRELTGFDGFPEFKIDGLGLFSPLYNASEFNFRLKRSFRALYRKNPGLVTAAVPDTNHNLEVLPPTFICTDEGEYCYRAAKLLHRLLDENNVPNELLVFDTPGFTRGFVEKDPDIPESVRAVSRMVRMFEGQ